MANGNKYGFGGIGAGGGIANLVAAPKVNQVRGMQFAPTPRLPVKSKKDNKKQLLGALLGSASPFLADVALEGLDKVGLPGLFEDDPLALQAQKSSLNSPVGEDGKTIPVSTLTQGSPEQIRQNIIRRRAEEINRASPNIAAKRKTGLGQLLSRGLEFAPAFAFAGDEADGSSEAFINSSNAARKLTAAMDASESDAAIRRAQSRSAEFAKIDPKFTAVKLHGTKEDKNGKLINYQTRGLRDEFGITWAQSRGNPMFDRQQGTNEVVPKDQYYRDSTMTLLDGEFGEISTKTFQDSGGATDGQLYEVQLVKTTDPKTGMPLQERRVLQDDGSYLTVNQMKQNGINLVSSVDLTTERAVPGRLKSDSQKKLEGFVTQQNATRNLVSLGTSIMERLGMNDVSLDENGKMKRDENGLIIGLDENITTGSVKWAAEMTDVLDRNVRLFGSKMAQMYGMNESDHTSVFNEFIFRNVDPDSGAAGLADALGYYQTALESNDKDEIKIARNFLIEDLMTIKNSTSKKDADTATSWLNLDREALSTYLQDTGFYGAAQIRLAFLMASARGESLSRISDRDVALNLQTMGFEDGSPSVVVEKLGGAIFDAIQNVDRENAGSATLRKIDNIDNETPKRQTEILEDIRDDFAAKYNLDIGPDSDIDKLYNSTDEAESRRLRRKIRGEAQKNTNGTAVTTFVYNPKLKMFLPATVAREILNATEPEKAKFNRYMQLLNYNLRDGTRPGKRSTVPSRARNQPTVKTKGGAKVTGAFSELVRAASNQEDDSNEEDDSR